MNEPAKEPEPYLTQRLEPDEVVALWQWHVEWYWNWYAVVFTCSSRRERLQYYWHGNRRQELAVWWASRGLPIPIEIVLAETKGEAEAKAFIRAYAEGDATVKEAEEPENEPVGNPVRAQTGAAVEAV